MMATEYCIKYSFTGQTNIRADGEEIAVTRDKFTLTGDTDKHVGKIAKIEFKHYHTSTSSPTWQLKGRLRFADGSFVDSDTVSHAFSSDSFQYVNTFADGLPSASVFDTWTQVSFVKANTPSSGDLYWRATADSPLELLVYFTESPPVYRGIGGAWVEVDSEGIFGGAGGAWKAVEEITKL